VPSQIVSLINSIRNFVVQWSDATDYNVPVATRALMTEEEISSLADLHFELWIGKCDLNLLHQCGTSLTNLCIPRGLQVNCENHVSLTEGSLNLLLSIHPSPALALSLFWGVCLCKKIYSSSIITPQHSFKTVVEVSNIVTSQYYWAAPFDGRKPRSQLGENDVSARCRRNSHAQVGGLKERSHRFLA